MAFHDSVLEEILQERVVSSRNRRNPRGVKRKMSNFPLRPRNAKPHPPIDIDKAIRIAYSDPSWTPFRREAGHHSDTIADTVPS